MPPGKVEGGRSRGARERLHGLRPIREALRARRRELHVLRLRRGSRRPELVALAAEAAAAGVSIEEVEPEVLRAEVPAGVNPQGAVLEAGPLPETSFEDLCRIGHETLALLALDGVEDPHNLGAVIRAAETAGVRALLLTRRRAAPLSPAVARASAGAVEWIETARVPNLSRALKELKSKGFWIFGGAPEAPLDLFGLPDRLLRGPRVLVLGAEGKGIRPGVARVLDHRVRIPMAGRVGSLNVAAATAVVLFELRRRDGVASSRGISYN